MAVKNPVQRLISALDPDKDKPTPQPPAARPAYSGPKEERTDYVSPEDYEMKTVEMPKFHQRMREKAARILKTPSYKKGTKYVPKTGVAKLHKGETILGKKQAKKYRSAKISGAAGALGAGKAKKSRRARRKNG